MRVPGLRSINAGGSPAQCAPTRDQHRLPHSPALGPVTQCGPKQTTVPAGRRCDFRHNNTARFGDDSYGQKLRSRLLREPSRRCSCTRIATGTLGSRFTILSRNSRNRRAGNKCRFDDASLLRRCTMNPFRRATGGNLNRLAHKAIVGLIAPSVYRQELKRILWPKLPSSFLSLQNRVQEVRAIRISTSARRRIADASGPLYWN